MSLLLASLYLLCLAFLFGSALSVAARDPFARLNASYALLAITLLGWVGTLFLFSAQTGGPTLLWLGRANFAAAALAAPATLQFVQALARKPSYAARWIWLESVILALVSLFTPSVDRNEAVQNTIHVTSYGPLFLLYALHVVAYLLAALVVAFQPAPQLSRQVRAQLRLVGIGLLLTAIVGVTANAVLPYLFGDFRFIHIGTLSTIFFLAAVASAASVYRLFNLRLVIRATVVFGVLVAFALELYQLAVEFLARLLPLGDRTQQHAAAATIALIINAFTHEPLRQVLERLVDRLLEDKRRHTRGVSARARR